MYQPIHEVNIRVGQKRTNRAEKNLKFILNHLNNPHASVIDIGSNLGFYTLRLAQKGMFVTGIESGRYNFFLSSAICACLDISNLSYYRTFITPENIDSLPTYDYSLLLNVFHHWVAEFGLQDSLQMLESYWRMTRSKMIISFNVASKNMKNMPVDQVADFEVWIRKFFTEKGAKGSEFLAHEEGRLLVMVEK